MLRHSLHHSIRRTGTLNIGGHVTMPHACISTSMRTTRIASVAASSMRGRLSSAFASGNIRGFSILSTLTGDSSATDPQSLTDKLTGASKYPTGFLVLEDGTRLSGHSFGDFRSVAGEVVFNTGLVGYNESLTDPSYKGQILVMTYPMIGNYGVPKHINDKWGLLQHFESDRIHVRGLIVQDYCEQYSHYLADQSLGAWLKQQNIPALFGIDTRALTKKIRDKTKGIRDKSSLLGKIIADTDVDFDDPNVLNLVEHVSCHGAKTYGKGDLRIMLLDVGAKNSIIRRLVQRGVSVDRCSVEL